VITPAASPPVAPAQEGALDRSFYHHPVAPYTPWEAMAAMVSPGLPNGTDEVMAAHSGRPTPAEAVARGVTPPPGG
jgi:hypothetical protein